MKVVVARSATWDDEKLKFGRRIGHLTHLREVRGWPVAGRGLEPSKTGGALAHSKRRDTR